MPASSKKRNASIRNFRGQRPRAIEVAETVAELVCHASRELHETDAVFTHSGSRRAGVAFRRWCPLWRSRRSGDAAAPGADWGALPRTSGCAKVDGLAKVAEKRLLESAVRGR